MGKRGKSGNNADITTCVKDTSNYKKNKFEDDNLDHEFKNEDRVVPKKMKGKITNKNASHSNNESNTQSKKNKKIKFNDDGTTDDTEILSNKRNKVKNPTTSQDDEENVKDEDIDKFCDEITEEDNVQFENWVKLIEDKLQPKKKPK